MKTRRVLFLIIGIISINFLFSQEKEKVVILPHRIAVKVLSDLETKDNLEIRINIKDSIISVLSQNRLVSDSIISTFKLNQRDYRKIIRLNKK